MPATIVTTEDLHDFKLELIEAFKKALSTNHYHHSKTWLKSSEVMELLKISPGTLQSLRVSGTLPFSKIGGLIYYDSSEINRVLEENSSKQSQ